VETTGTSSQPSDGRGQVEPHTPPAFGLLEIRRLERAGGVDVDGKDRHAEAAGAVDEDTERPHAGVVFEQARVEGCGVVGLETRGLHRRHRERDRMRPSEAFSELTETAGQLTLFMRCACEALRV
jgi:hypothetical protein